MTDVQRPHAEERYAAELDALGRADRLSRPPHWRLSPQAVVTYLMGGQADGVQITPKYVGARRLIEVAVATLATDRALLLLGVPGTAKTWVSEHLAAAISGDSTLLVQGTAGTAEEAIRYGWNYARLLAEGPSADALVPSPVMASMRLGTLVRIEELTDVYRDLLNGATEVHLSTVSNRLNEVMKQLTVIATVFLPLTFLTGFFGQNFGWMVDHVGGPAPFLLLGVGLQAATVGALLLLFRRRGWI